MGLEGSQLGIYRVGDELGRGGMGAVYRGAAVIDGPAGPVGSEVALKVFHPHLVAGHRAFERFRREAEIGKRIRHPHVVRTYDVGQEEIDGEAVHYMVMEVIEGRTLQGLVEDLGTIPENLLFRIADQVLDALDAFHSRGVVHRDIKPENIVITPDDRVLLMDLGVARMQGEAEALTQAGEFVGSLAYAPPEQFVPQEGGVGPRADLYAFGIVLFELATGRNPYDLTDVSALLQKKLQEEVQAPRTVLPELDAFWNEVIVTSTRSRASDRFGSAAELRRILQEGEESDWWRQRSAGVTVPSAERALKRLRLEREAPLIGRAEELSAVRGRWAHARDGGGVLLLSGPSGVGKSRLLYDFLEEVASAGGPAVAAGRALGPDGRSYQPFIDALNDLVETGEIDRAQVHARLEELLSDTPAVVPHFADFLLDGVQPNVESGFSKDALLAACARIVQRLADRRPVILSIEDLHLADADTVELFDYLARAVDEHPALLVGVYADDELDEASPIRGLADQAGVDDVAVAPLDYASTEQLVRAIVGVEKTVRALAHPLHERGDGSPLIVLEMLAHLKESEVLAATETGLEVVGSLEELAVPSTVRDLVGLKLGRLDDEARETLEAAAVLGIDFDSSLLADVLEEKPIKLLQRLATLERKDRLLQSSGKDSFRFASRQLFEAVYDEITPALRSEYHALVADTILEELDDEEPEGATAYSLLRHLFHAERVLEAEPYLESAIDYMQAHFHAGDSAPFLEKVAVEMTDAPAPKRFALAMKLWAFYELLASRTDQLRVLEQAREMADAMGDAGARAHVYTCIAATYYYTGKNEEAAKEAEQGLALARDAGDEKWEGNALHLLGAVAHKLGEFARAASHFRAALEIRTRIGDRRGKASGLMALGTVMPQIGEGDQALATKQTALEIFRELGSRRGEAAMLNNVANALVELGRHEESLEYFGRATEISRELGAHGSEAHQLCNLGHAQSQLARIERAKASFDRALQLFRVLNNPNGELAVLTLVGPVLTAYGDYGLARERLLEAEKLAEQTGLKHKLIVAERELGTLEHLTGAHAKAWNHFERTLALEDEVDSPLSRFVTLNSMGVAAMREGDNERALKCFEEAVALGGERSDPNGLVTRCRLARVQKRLGNDAEAGEQALLVREMMTDPDAVSGDVGPEIFFTLHELTDDTGEYLDRAVAFIESRQAAIGNDAYREHYLAQAWPNPAILLAHEKRGGRSRP